MLRIEDINTQKLFLPWAVACELTVYGLIEMSLLELLEFNSN